MGSFEQKQSFTSIQERTTKFPILAKVKGDSSQISNEKLQIKSLIHVEGEEYLSPQKFYIEEEHSISFNLSQGRDKASEEPITFSIEQGMTSKVPFVQ